MHHVAKFARTSKLAAASLFAAAAMCAGSAAAGVLVSDIRVTSGYTGTDAYIQLAEIIVTQAYTGINVANTGTATGSGSYSTESTPDKAIDGVSGGQPYPNMYHSSSGTNAFFDLAFSAPVDIDSVTLFGRVGCCDARDIYNISFFDANHALAFAVTNASAYNNDHSVTVKVPEPAPLALFGIAAVGFAAARRRKSSK